MPAERKGTEQKIIINRMVSKTNPFLPIHEHVGVHLTKLIMKRENEVYCLTRNYSPFIYKNKKDLMYYFPVESGHASISLEFQISEQDLKILMSSDFRFKAFYYILFYEAQSTFGTGHRNPRKYTTEEFESAKTKVLYQSENDLKLYITEFSKQRNLAENYFESFSKIVFEKQ